MGNHTQWDLKLDARLAYALMSIQAIKGVEFGLGYNVSNKYGSEVHDEIFYEKSTKRSLLTGGFKRHTNNAGGIEGGISNGEPIVARAHMKPIPTLKKPLRSVDLITKEPIEASYERSDVCAVPAASVVCEGMVAFEIARAFLEKFGGDSLDEVKRNYEGYLSNM
ncbi:MAG: Chorismate synthase [Candidatus Jettenia ecosi]|uniref:chorismate synthase n=1 Tax=Candidatus Jettenia ecosi TaxID=2494326 RepID=A0A533QFL7_9BACT|nr:MAG: Chorismate synthase [Candidatus Jettenia ecosi]